MRLVEKSGLYFCLDDHEKCSICFFGLMLAIDSTFHLQIENDRD